MSSAGAGDNAAPCLALDIGASKIDGALVAADGTILIRERLFVNELGNDLLTPIVQCCRNFKNLRMFRILELDVLGQ